MTGADPQFIERLARSFTEAVPHVRALGIVLEYARSDQVCARLPARAELVGDPRRGLIHGGAITTLIDSVSGIAVFARLGVAERIATLDLRVDYLRPASADRDLRCEAECYRLTSQIAFVRARVVQDDPALPIAESLSTFMRTPLQNAPRQKTP